LPFRGGFNSKGELIGACSFFEGCSRSRFRVQKDLIDGLAMPTTVPGVSLILLKDERT